MFTELYSQISMDLMLSKRKKGNHERKKQAFGVRRLQHMCCDHGNTGVGWKASRSNQGRVIGLNIE